MVSSAGMRKAVLREEKPDCEETIRIISARDANPSECRIYLEQTTD